MNSVKNIVLPGKYEKPILTDLFYNPNGKKKPVVIFCHGYKGFKDWGCWDLVARKFADADMFFIKFNFSHNGGTIEQPVDFPDLEAFAQNNYIIELDDLQSVLSWIRSEPEPYKKEMDSEKIILIGHSRGGGIVTIKASEDQEIHKVITWAGVSDYGRRFPKGEALAQWKKEGVMYVENGRTKQQMPHNFQFYSSFIANENRLTISRAAKALSIPYLIIHGTEDPTVSVKEAKALASWTSRSELYLVSGADHVFDARHPWNQDSLPEALKDVVSKSIAFAIL